MSQTPSDKEAIRAARIAEAAARALAEAEERRAAGRSPEAVEAAMPAELGGRNGPEPTRFGDWEKKGIISDF
ncbi:DUF1674 domain-containing protein [Paroceanicella profunda]|uniref:DUF1674 domain-containing protein n=1 Tax=Paroceanicella profunda TaxID=2579971 RepID=A0A5B8FWB7_9RHOB|nr:DUF1674 domain-containing protein [Paroceanicella profunda]QDL91784.1 DUF1674 domain-containing protein [Paroceanicella profunda]